MTTISPESITQSHLGAIVEFFRKDEVISENKDGIKTVKPKDILLGDVLEKIVNTEYRHEQIDEIVDLIVDLWGNCGKLSDSLQTIFEQVWEWEYLNRKTCKKHGENFCRCEEFKRIKPSVTQLASFIIQVFNIEVK